MLESSLLSPKHDEERWGEMLWGHCGQARYRYLFRSQNPRLPGWNIQPNLEGTAYNAISASKS